MTTLTIVSSFAKFYYLEGVQYRTLIKAYGILFKIQITGQVK